MIKNPKIGQPVYFLDGENNVVRGKITQTYNSISSGSTGTVGINNFFYVSKGFVFSTKKDAETYKSIKDELNNLNGQIQTLSKKREKLATKLAKILE